MFGTENMGSGLKVAPRGPIDLWGGEGGGVILVSPE